MKKYYILAFTFLCLLMGNTSYGQDYIETNYVGGGSGTAKSNTINLNAVTVISSSSSTSSSYGFTPSRSVSPTVGSQSNTSTTVNYGDEGGGSGSAIGDAVNSVEPTAITTPENIISKFVITPEEFQRLLVEFFVKYNSTTVVYAFVAGDGKTYVGHLTVFINPDKTDVKTCYFKPVTTDGLYNTNNYYRIPDPNGALNTIYLGGKDTGINPNFNSQLGTTEYQYSYSNIKEQDVDSYSGVFYGVGNSGISYNNTYTNYETNDMSGNYVYSGWNHWFEMAMKYHCKNTTEVDILYESGPNWFLGDYNLGLYGQRVDVENLMDTNTLLNDSSITREDLFPLTPFLIDKAKPYSEDVVAYCKDIIEYNRDPLENTGADNPKIVVGAAPTPFYKSLLGHPGYYHWRTRDFMRRNPGKNPPDYYMEYEAKYINRFTNETSIVLSASGNKWLKEVRVNLQEAMEDKLQADKTIELGETAFSTFAFDSYVDSYLNNKNPDNTSLFSLNTVDLVAIVMTPDFNDLKTKEQTEKIVQKLSDYWASNPAEAEKRASEFLAHEDTIKLRIMEKALREGIDPSVALQTMGELLLDKVMVVNDVMVVNNILPTNNFVDTKDYVFDSTGKPLKAGKDGHKVKIMVNGVEKLPSELDPTNLDQLKALLQVEIYLAIKAGAPIGSWFSIGKSSDPKGLSSSEVAFTKSTKPHMVVINSRGGKFSTALDDYYSFINVIQHELGHRANFYSTNPHIPDNLSTHVDVYINAMAKLEFKSSPPEFRLSITNSLGNYLLNMDNRTDNFYIASVIKDKIDAFNKSHPQYELRYPYDYDTKGKLTLTIKDTTTFNDPTPVIYKKIIDEF